MVLIKFKLPTFHQVFPSLGCWLAVLLHTILNVPVKVSPTKKGFRKVNGKYPVRVAWGEKWAKYQFVKMLPVKQPWQWSCQGFRRLPWLEDTEGTAQQQCHILGAGIIVQWYHPSLHVNSPPTGQHKSPEAETSRVCFQRPFRTVSSMPGSQPCAWSTWTAPIPHCPAGNSNYGALLCFIFLSLSSMLPQDGWKVMRHLQCLSALC